MSIFIVCMCIWVCTTWNARNPSSSSPGEEIGYSLQYSWAFLVVQMVKNLPAMQETGFNPRVGKIPWKTQWQLTIVFFPGESPWTEEPGRLQSMGLQRVGHNWTIFTICHLLATKLKEIYLTCLYLGFFICKKNSISGILANLFFKWDKTIFFLRKHTILYEWLLKLNLFFDYSTVVIFMSQV